jgi:PAS domain S-box-containing protein
MNNLSDLKEIASEYKVLYVEDDKDIADILINYLSKFFKEVVYAQNGENGLELFKNDEYDIVITDIVMPKMDGLEMSEKIKEINKNQNIIIVSAYSDIENFLTSIKIGVDGYIIKPVDYTDINAMLYKTVLKIKAFKDNEKYEKELKKLLQELENSNSELEQYIKTIDKVAIVSRANLKGYITYANDSFCEISGYSFDELIGQNHNIIRHPDMSKEVFKNLWETIQAGNIWDGTIKNKTKNGDAYFTHSAVMPILDKEHDTIKEYISISFVTTKDEEEKRDFKKKVRTNYIEFKKTNMNAIERIAELEKELEELKTQQQQKQSSDMMNDKKYKQNLSQIRYFEKQLKDKEVQHKKLLELQKYNLNTLSESHKKSLITIDKQRKQISTMKEELDIRVKEVMNLTEKQNEQMRIIHDLRDTIKSLREKN